MYRIMGLLAVLAVATIAALLLQANHAAAQVNYCPASGIVHDSVSVTSSDYRTGQVAGHAVRFQLCMPITAASNARSSPPRLALLWDSDFDGEALLGKLDSAGITLREVGGAGKWTTITEIPSYADRTHYFEGLAIEFAPGQLSSLETARTESPLALEFNIPASAGLINPNIVGSYRWAVTIFRESLNFCWDFPAQAQTQSIIPPTITTEPFIYLSHAIGPPGTEETVVGTGFRPFTLVDNIKVGPLDVSPRRKASTDLQGKFALQITIPGLDTGYHLISVQVGENDAAVGFQVTESGVTGPVTQRFDEAVVERLGDNFVVSFHFNEETEQWTYYDPEFPHEGGLAHVVLGECYWLLVKEPQEVILNNQYRNLTCTSRGYCWNLIMW